MYQVSLRYFGITFLIIMTCNIQAKEAMNWSVTHWPPLLILKGENAGNGRYDVFLKYFEQQMPQYTHQSIDTNWTRVWRDIKAGKKICNMLALKNSERQDIALFSKPAGITLSNRIIMRESTYKQLGQPQKMALTELFNHPHLKGVIESSRSYTPVLDSLIKNKLQASNLEARKTNSIQLLKMLLMKRFDYMIEYPYIADYLYRGTPQTPVTIRSVEIEEIKPFYASYLACPKTAWGAERISAYNAALDQIKHTEKYLKIMQMWYSNEEEKSAVRTGFKAVLDSQ